MSIEKQKREDLLHEATAFERRILLQLDVSPPTAPPTRCNRVELFGGFRQGGGWSLYFDEQPVLQFNAAGQLRRLFLDDRKLLCERGQLIELQRSVQGGKVEFQRVVVAAEVERQYLARCTAWLEAATQALEQQRYQVVGQYPSRDAELLGDLTVTLERLKDGFPLADAPGAHA